MRPALSTGHRTRRVQLPRRAFRGTRRSTRSFRSAHPSHPLIRQGSDRFTCACSAPDRHPTRIACNRPATRTQDATHTILAERPAHCDYNEGLAPQHRALLSYDRQLSRHACDIPGVHPGASDKQSFHSSNQPSTTTPLSNDLTPSTCPARHGTEPAPDNHRVRPTGQPHQDATSTVHAETAYLE